MSAGQSWCFNGTPGVCKSKIQSRRDKGDRIIVFGLPEDDLSQIAAGRLQGLYLCVICFVAEVVARTRTRTRNSQGPDFLQDDLALF